MRPTDRSQHTVDVRTALYMTHGQHDRHKIQRYDYKQGLRKLGTETQIVYWKLREGESILEEEEEARHSETTRGWPRNRNTLTYHTHVNRHIDGCSVTCLLSHVHTACHEVQTAHTRKHTLLSHTSTHHSLTRSHTAHNSTSHLSHTQSHKLDTRLLPQ